MLELGFQLVLLHRRHGGGLLWDGGGARKLLFEGAEALPVASYGKPETATSNKRRLFERALSRGRHRGSMGCEAPYPWRRCRG
jgi:hypothetical protein